MIRFKDIQIPKPCSVDYDSLPGNEVKRFCGSCEKHVYDFRGKDEAYFNSIINSHGKVCAIFYEDDIQPTILKIKRPFYYAFAVKLIGALLFIKTLLSSEHAQAVSIRSHTTTQQSVDSIGVKVEFKNQRRINATYVMSIYINNVIYTSGTNLDHGTGYIWLPDSLKENDKIRVTIQGSKRKFHAHVYKIKNHGYNFLYKNSDAITIKINNTKKVILIRKKRRQLAGKYSPQLSN